MKWAKSEFLFFRLVRFWGNWFGFWSFIREWSCQCSCELVLGIWKVTWRKLSHWDDRILKFISTQAVTNTGAVLLFFSNLWNIFGIRWLNVCKYQTRWVNYFFQHSIYVRHFWKCWRSFWWQSPTWILTLKLCHHGGNQQINHFACDRDFHKHASSWIKSIVNFSNRPQWLENLRIKHLLKS